MKKVKFSDIELAFEFVSYGAPSEHTALLDKATGQLHYHSEYGDFDEIPEAIWESDQSISIPHKTDLDLGNRLVFRFIRSVMPDEEERVRRFFSRRGAYARYKDWLESEDLLQQWYDFENAETVKALRQWCTENEIELDD